MLRRLQQLHNQGLSDKDIHISLQYELNGLPKHLGEVKAELMFMNGKGLNRQIVSAASRIA